MREQKAARREMRTAQFASRNGAASSSAGFEDSENMKRKLDALEAELAELKRARSG